MTTNEWDDIVIDHIVLSATVTGDTQDFFELPGGPIGFAAGVEYRREESEARFDEWQRGVIPEGSPFPAGTLLSDVSDNDSLTFRPQLAVKNESGDYTTDDVFLEVSLPLLSDMPFAE